VLEDGDARLRVGPLAADLFGELHQLGRLLLRHPFVGREAADV
jgi:hypothetical protein